MDVNVKICKRLEVVCLGMLAPRKFMRKKKKIEVFKDPEDEADQKKWRRLMKEIEEVGSAVTVLKRQKPKNEAHPKDLVIGTLVRFKQLKKWNLVGEVCIVLLIIYLFLVKFCEAAVQVVPLANKEVRSYIFIRAIDIHFSKMYN